MKKAWLKSATKYSHLRLSIPAKYVVQNLHKFDVIENIDSPEFEWFKFQGKTTLFPISAPYQDLKIKSVGSDDGNLICTLLNLDTRRRLTATSFHYQYILYSGGYMGIYTGFNSIVRGSWFYTPSIYIDEIIDAKFLDFPIYEMTKDIPISGIRFKACLKDVLTKFDDFILEKYTGKIEYESHNYIACGNNILYSKKAGIILLDANLDQEVIFRPPFCFRPYIAKFILVNKLLKTYN